MLAQLCHYRQSSGNGQENRPEARVVAGGQGPIQVEDTTIRQRDGRSYNGSLLYTVKPIEQILKEREKEFLAELKLEEAPALFCTGASTSARNAGSFREVPPALFWNGLKCG